MTIISKATAYPKSVRPGIPKLGKKPEGWLREPLSKHLKEVLRPIELEDESKYRLVTVKRSRGGVVEREDLLGRDIAVKSQFTLKAGDFLISKRQIVHGACGVVPQELDGTVVSNEYSVLNSLGTIDLEFLKYLSHSSYFQETCFHSSIGVHVEKMIFKLEDWLKWQFDLPNVTEQRRIAEILSTWDKAIAVQEKLVANAKAHKKALMQQLLTGKKRLPAFKGEWKKVKLGQLGEFRKGKGISRAEVLADGLPCVRYGEIYTHHHDVIRKFNSFISQISATESEEITCGDIVFTCSGETAEEIGKCVAFVHHQKAYAGGDTVIFKPRDSDSIFLSYVLNSQPIAAQKAQMGQGNSVVHISAANLAKLQFAVPETDEQREIGIVVNCLDEEIIRLSAELDGFRQEKSALMQQLLTGKRRVKAEASA